MSALVVIAKECLVGRVKTRLHPPFSLADAAALASASLADTLDTVRATPAHRRILYLDGSPDSIDTEGFEVIPQTGGPLDDRLAAIFDLLDEPTLLIGMDTPQVTTAHLSLSFEDDSIFGPAQDGGFWAIGMRAPRGDVIRGVPMSRSDTGARQLAALRGAGLGVVVIDELTDIDDARSAQVVAQSIPGTRFAAAYSEAVNRLHGRIAS